MLTAAIIVAGGSGTRMGADRPKQFLEVGGRPILFHTIEKFSGLVDELIVVLPESHLDYWKTLCESLEFGIVHRVVPGGTSRTQSVRSGLHAVSDCDVVAIHDAVRPLVSRELIRDLLISAFEKGNAIPALAPRESMRRVKGRESKAVDRDDYVWVQTPQCFDYKTIVKHYENAAGLEFTDDASLAEAMGEEIRLVQGDMYNLKITIPEDLVIAECLLSASKS